MRKSYHIIFRARVMPDTSIWRSDSGSSERHRLSPMMQRSRSDHSSAKLAARLPTNMRTARSPMRWQKSMARLINCWSSGLKWIASFIAATSIFAICRETCVQFDTEAASSLYLSENRTPFTTTSEIGKKFRRTDGWIKHKSDVNGSKTPINPQPYQPGSTTPQAVLHRLQKVLR